MTKHCKERIIAQRDIEPWLSNFPARRLNPTRATFFALVPYMYLGSLSDAIRDSHPAVIQWPRGDEKSQAKLPQVSI